mmetsp:Transcript_39998/g.103304  ORF Transcript_39998/g.103304 Transcript_39998/m.103304 type:complete len:292 (+) Transcript_39998:292-1167(+)
MRAVAVVLEHRLLAVCADRAHVVEVLIHALAVPHLVIALLEVGNANVNLLLLTPQLREERSIHIRRAVTHVGVADLNSVSSKAQVSQQRASDHGTVHVRARHLFCVERKIELLVNPSKVERKGEVLHISVGKIRVVSVSRIGHLVGVDERSHGRSSSTTSRHHYLNEIPVCIAIVKLDSQLALWHNSEGVGKAGLQYAQVLDEASLARGQIKAKGAVWVHTGVAIADHAHESLCEVTSSASIGHGVEVFALPLSLPVLCNVAKRRHIVKLTIVCMRNFIPLNPLTTVCCYS